MKDISSVESLTIPEGVTVGVKSRIVTVEGPRGKLQKNVGHVQMDIQLVSQADEVVLPGRMVRWGLRDKVERPAPLPGGRRDCEGAM